MKKILLFVICLFLTGCSTEVVIKIDEDKASETIKISKSKLDAYSDGVLREDIKFNLKVFEREYEFYNIEEFEDNEYVGKTYKISEDLELWAEVSHVRPCYEKFKLEKTDTNISLTTSEEYRCGYLFGAENVTLIIESDLELVSSNADKIDGNKLIWNINPNNYKNKSINFNYKIGNLDKIKDFDIKYILIFVSIIVVIIGIYVLKKYKESNKI